MSSVVAIVVGEEGEIEGEEERGLDVTTTGRL